MSHLVLAAGLSLGASALASDPGAYPLTVDLVLPAAELVRVDLGADWLARCPDPHSYLLLDAEGNELPFAVRDSDAASPWRAVALTWQPERSQGRWTWRVHAPASGEPAHALRLAGLPRGAVAVVELRSLADEGGSLQQVLWNLPGTGAGIKLDLELEKGLSNGPWRVSAAPAEGLPWRRAGFDMGFEALLAEPWGVQTVTLPLALDGPVPSGETSSDWSLRLPRAGLPLRGLSLRVEDSLFSREVSLLGVEGEAQRPLGEGSLERLAFGPARVERTELALDVQAPDELVLRLDDGRSAPLGISGAQLAMRGVALVVPGDAGGEHRLFGCGSHLAAYDIERLGARLAEGVPARVVAGPPEPNAAWRPDAAGEGLLGAGPVLDTAGLRFERPVTGGPGLIRVALDDHVQANTHTSHRDLRFVDDQDRQLPFLLRAGGAGRLLDVSVGEPVQEHGRSVIHLQLPEDGVPAQALGLRSSRTHFRREVRATSGLQEGGPVLFSVHWQGADEGESRLVVPLHRKLPRDLLLTIDNGDNPPLPVDHVQLVAPSVHAWLSLPAQGSVRLLYGSEGLSAPSYDLELLRERVLTQPVEEARLGEVVEREPPAPDRRSGLLLGAVALLSMLLLGLIVRLLRTPVED